MNLHVLHGSAWSGAGTSVLGYFTGDQITYATGIAIAVASAAVAGVLALWGRIQDERRRQEWLDFELRQKMLAESRAVVDVSPAVQLSNAIQTK